MPTLDLVRVNYDCHGPLTKGLAYSLDGAWLAFTEAAKQVHILNADTEGLQQTIASDHENRHFGAWAGRPIATNC